MPRGYLDHATRRCIRGWAVADVPARGPAQVEIRIDGELVACLTANQSRDDLVAPLGSARHGFELFLPGLCPLRRHVVSARVEGAGRDLPNSPQIIEAADAFDGDVESALSRLIAAADAPTLGRATLVMSEQIDHALDRRAALASHDEARDLRYRWFAHRGAPLEARPPSVPKQALLVIAGAEAADGFDGFLLTDRAVALRRMGYDVAVVAADLAPLGSAERTCLLSHGIDLPCRPFTASIEELLRRQGTLDVVLLVGRTIAARYLALAESLCPRAKIGCVATARDRARLSPGFGLREWATSAGAPSAMRDFPTILTAPETRSSNAGEFVVPWAAAARPSRTPLQRRHGVAILDDMSTLAPILVELVAEALTKMGTMVPSIRAIWRHTPPPDFADHAAAPDGTSIAALAEQARVAVTLATTSIAYRDVVACAGVGLPCVAPTQVLRDLGLQHPSFAFDTSSASGLAATLARLHDDPVRNADVRKRCLDDLDLRHAPDAVDATWKAVLRARRGKLWRPSDAHSGLVETAVC